MAPQLTRDIVAERALLHERPPPLIDAEYVIHSPFEDIVIPSIPLHSYVMQDWHYYPDVVAITDAVTRNSLTYRQISCHVKQLAAALHAYGYRTGQGIAVLCANRIEYPVIEYALSTLGITMVTINAVYQSEEVAHNLRVSESVAVFVDNDLIGRIDTNLVSSRNIHPMQPQQGYVSYTELLKRGSSLSVPVIDVDPSSIVVMPFSSGTTGPQKAVALSHYNIVANLEQRSQPTLDFPVHRENVLCALPMSHSFGHTVSMNLSLRHGAHVVVVPRFEPELYLRTCQDFKIGSIALVVPTFLFLARHPSVPKYDLSCLRSIYCSAAPLSEAQEMELLKRFPQVKIRQGYGQTEVAPGSHTHSIDRLRPGTVGRLLSSMKAVIVDPDTGKRLPAGEAGELLLKGPNVFVCYFNNPEATRNAFTADGWLKTGDIAIVDELGYFKIVDRLKELIKVNALQVAPAELEALINVHPSVEVSAVVPVPDERAGELPFAFVVLKPKAAPITEEDIVVYVEKHVAKHKRLAGGVMFVKQLPMLASGKILRRKLRDVAREEKIRRDAARRQHQQLLQSKL